MTAYITRGVEDYLKAIFFLKQDSIAINNKNISEKLNVAPPSVTEMLRKMEKIGYLIIKKREITLTELGSEIAHKIIRKHRVWEEFLINKLDFDVSNVHEEAEKLEHATSDALLEKLEKFLNYKYSIEDYDYK